MKLLTEITGGIPINSGGLHGLGKLNDFTRNAGGEDAFAAFISVFSTALGILTISAGIWFIVQILSGSIQWLSSGGEKQGVENARKRITNAVMGLFIVIFSYALISIIGLVFGFNILSPFNNILSTGWWISSGGSGGGGGSNKFR